VPTPQPSPAPDVLPTWTFSPLPTSTNFVIHFATFPPAVTATVSPTPTPFPTETITPTADSAWVFQPAGEHLVPILLYHQIGYSRIQGNEYYISPEEFDKQMALLHAWGYETIPVEVLAYAILNGAELPQKPIILTFDDGNDNTYTTVFPILQKYNFTGTTYIVYNYVGAARYMNKKQIQELYEAGWEIGSHSLSHKDLTQNPKRIESEIVDSRLRLQALLEVPITSFAYPFGAYNDDALYYVKQARYIDAVGLGVDMHQNNGNIYYLPRREVKGSYDLMTFAQFLPWLGDPIYLQMNTSIP